MRTAFCFLCLALCGAAQADIYRYVDERGVTVYTDRPPAHANAKLLISSEPASPSPSYGPVRTHARASRPSLRATAVFDAAGRLAYEAAIRAAAAASDMEPALIHAVISAESGYNPYARSRHGALGLMQLMPETAKRYNVRNRLDPVQNIEGGTRYLRDLMRLFDNDLRLALAAYNAGEQTVIKYGRRIPPNPETLTYVPRVLEFYRRYKAQI